MGSCKLLLILSCVCTVLRKWLADFAPGLAVERALEFGATVGTIFRECPAARVLAAGELALEESLAGRPP